MVWNSKYSGSSANAPSAVRRITFRTCVDHRRAAVGGEPHHLVFVLVDREAEIGGERRVEHAERVREADLAQRASMSVPPSARARAVPDRQRRPFADAVRGEDRGAPRRRGEERGGGVRRVVLGEQDLLPRHAEMRRDDAAHPDLLAERVLDRVRKRSPRARERAQRAGQDPLELQHAALVEHDRVEIGRLEPGAIEAPLDGADAGTPRRSCGATAAPPARRATGTPSTTSAAAES